MPFQSKRQMRAAYAGTLGELMKRKAPEWSSKTDMKSLPERARINKKFRKKKK
jgi:hypothetical protein